MAYGVWRMAYGVWRMAYGVWRMAYGVWRMAYGVECLKKVKHFFSVIVFLCSPDLFFQESREQLPRADHLGVAMPGEMGFGTQF